MTENFIRKGKTYLIVVLMLVTVVMLRCLCEKNQPSSEGLVESITSLVQNDFTPAEIIDHPIIPDSVDIPNEDIIEATLTGHGHVSVCDTVLPVLVEYVKPLDTTPFVKVTVGDSTVVFEELKYYDSQEGLLEAPHWRVGIGACLIHETIEPSLTGLYYPLKTGSVSIGIGVGVGNAWVAPMIRVAHDITKHSHVGAGIGHRFFEDEGLHIEVGIEFDL